MRNGLCAEIPEGRPPIFGQGSPPRPPAQSGRRGKVGATAATATAAAAPAPAAPAMATTDLVRRPSFKLDEQEDEDAAGEEAEARAERESIPV